MNYGDPKAPQVHADALVWPSRKEDGSLGIGWTYAGHHYGVATRGSFTSDQSKHATALLTDGIKENIAFNVSKGLTPIYEIVYPENRIVLQYHGRDELIPLGWVANASGIITERGAAIRVGSPILFSQAVSLKVPADEEGYVLDILNLDYPNGTYEVTGHVKLKGEEYKILHGLLTNTNARRIWVQLAARECHQWIEHPDDWANKLGHDPADFARVDVTKDIVDTLLTNVPDEFYDWVTKQIDSINDRVLDLIAQSISLAGQVCMIDDKRARFELVKGHPMCKEILSHATSEDRMDVSKIILKAWKLAKPAGNDTPFSTQEED